MAYAGFTELMEQMFGDLSARFEVRPPLPGKRHNQSPIVVAHRFPVKGGLTPAQVMARNLSENNALLSHLKKKSSTEPPTSES